MRFIASNSAQSVGLTGRIICSYINVSSPLIRLNPWDTLNGKPREDIRFIASNSAQSVGPWRLISPRWKGFIASNSAQSVGH